MQRMLIICPTYKRPEMCETMIKSYIKTRASENAEINTWSDMILGLSANDPCIPEYMALSLKYNIAAETFDTNSTTEIFNQLWKKYKENYYCFHMTNDDVIYETQDWDGQFIATLDQQGGGIVYGDDKFHGAGLCTLPCISSSVLNALGWLQYPGLDKLFGDAVWMKIGNQVPCIYWNYQVKMEHKHWINGKREKDSTAEEYLVGYRRDEMIYKLWENNIAQSNIDKVKMLFTPEQLGGR